MVLSRTIMTPDAPTDAPDPCYDCGACCRTYRVSFYWSEADQRGIPPDMVEQVTPHLSCMKGTNSKQPFCTALTDHFRCAIYPARSSTCREVEIGDAKCNQARAVHGLPPMPDSVGVRSL